jgi:hypothetical protein
MRFLYIILLSVPFILNAQDEGTGGGGFLNGFAFGASAGPTTFYGDLSEFDVLPKKPSNSALFGNAYNVFVSRNMYEGFGLKLTYENGHLLGGRQPGSESVPVNFETQFQSGSFTVNFELLDAFHGSKSETMRKFYIDMEAGVGMMMYRSVSYWSDSNRAREFVGYTEPEESIGQTRKELLNVADPLQAITVPVGVSFGWRLNHKTDINLNATLHNTFTDELDTWLRDWTAKDKYLFTGIGIRYNFKRSTSDYPPMSDRKQARLAEKEADRMAAMEARENGGQGAASTQKSGGGGLFGMFKKQQDVQQNTNNNGGGESLDMLNLQLQMFELQMKLFELFYLEKK